MIGLALGFVLFHSRFGFTSAWRQLVAVRQGKALRAHMLMLAVACTLFAPILANRSSFGDVPAAPTLAPIGFGLFVGVVPVRRRHAARRLVRVGTLFADRQRPDRDPDHPCRFHRRRRRSAPATSPGGPTTCPAHAPVSLTDTRFGYPARWVISLAVMAVDRRRSPTLLARNAAVPPVEPAADRPRPARAVRGAWPLWVGALLLAVLNAAHPVRLRRRLGRDVRVRPVGLEDPRRRRRRRARPGRFWQDPANAREVHAGVLAEKTSVMDFGIIVGALIASAAAGAFVAAPPDPAALALGSVHRRPADGLRRPDRLRLQHRRLLRWHRVVQPARLALGHHRRRRHLRRPARCGRCSGCTNPKPSDSIC